MTKEDIELTVLNIMDEVTPSSPERTHLMARVERARHNELIHFERRKQVLLRLMLYALVGILVLTAVQPLAARLASLPPKHHVSSTPPSAVKPRWNNPWANPVNKPIERYSP